MDKQPVVNKGKLAGYSALLSILVVMIHTQNTGIYCISPASSSFDKIVYYLQQFISGDIARIGVPAFFMFSGLLFYRDFDFSKYPQKMKSRFFSLMIPYLAWNFFRFALFYGLGKFGIVEDVLHISRVVFTPENFLEGVFLYKYNLGYWFMYQLILYTLLCPLIYILLKKKWVGILSLITLFVLFCTDLLGDISIHVFHKKFIQIDGLFYYMLGAYIGMHRFDLVNANSKLTKWLAVGGMLLGQIFFILFHHTPFLVFHISFCTISAISSWYLFDCFSKKTWPVAITSITFFIYSAHGTILEFVQAFDNVMFPANAVTALLEYLLLPVVTFFLLVLISKFMKRYTKRLWKVVNGGR